MFERHRHQARNGNFPFPGEQKNHHPNTRSSFPFLGPVLLDSVSRRVEHADYRFACASGPHEIASAAQLVARRYAWRGYRIERPRVPSDRRDELTLIASCANQVHGTLTVRIDNGVPLLSEALYPDEIHRMRAAGSRLCEFGRLAFSENVSTLELLGPLFHLAVAYAHDSNACTDAVVEVNPRHAFFYRNLFGFRPLGGERICPRVSAPAVLLKLSLEEAAKRVKDEGGRRKGRRSIYPYCFGHRELDLEKKPPVESTHREFRPVVTSRDVIYS